MTIYRWFGAAATAAILVGCGAADFGSKMTFSKATEDASEVNDDEDFSANIPQLTLEDFMAAIEDDPNEKTLFDGVFRCYISHSGGHGVELCQAGDKMQLISMANSWKDTRAGEPVEVKGNDLCVRPAFILAMPALFAGAAVGTCM